MEFYLEHRSYFQVDKKKKKYCFMTTNIIYEAYKTTKLLNSPYSPQWYFGGYKSYTHLLLGENNPTRIKSFYKFQVFFFFYQHLNFKCIINFP